MPEQFRYRVHQIWKEEAAAKQTLAGSTLQTNGLRPVPWPSVVEKRKETPFISLGRHVRVLQHDVAGDWLEIPEKRKINKIFQRRGA